VCENYSPVSESIVWTRVLLGGLCCAFQEYMVIVCDFGHNDIKEMY